MAFREQESAMAWEASVRKFDGYARRADAYKCRRAQNPSATDPEGIMLHGEVIYAVVFSGTGFASDAVGIALESGGYSRRTPTGALNHHPRDGAQRLAS